MGDGTTDSESEEDPAPGEVPAGAYVPAKSIFYVNEIAEKTPGAGVTVGGIVLKDQSLWIPEHLYVDSIDSFTDGAGVTIEGVKTLDSAMTGITLIDAATGLFSSINVSWFHEAVQGEGIQVRHEILSSADITAKDIYVTKLTADGVIAGPTIDSASIKTTTISAKSVATGVHIENVIFKEDSLTVPVPVAAQSTLTVTGASEFMQKVDVRGTVIAHDDLTVMGTLYADIDATSLTLDTFHSDTGKFTFVGASANLTIAGGDISVSSLANPDITLTPGTGGDVIIQGGATLEAPKLGKVAEIHAADAGVAIIGDLSGILINDNVIRGRDGDLVLGVGGSGTILRMEASYIDVPSANVRLGNTLNVGTILPPSGEDDITIGGSTTIDTSGMIRTPTIRVDTISNEEKQTVFQGSTDSVIIMENYVYSDAELILRGDSGTVRVRDSSLIVEEDVTISGSGGLVVTDGSVSIPRGDLTVGAIWSGSEDPIVIEGVKLQAGNIVLATTGGYPTRLDFYEASSDVVALDGVWSDPRDLSVNFVRVGTSVTISWPTLIAPTFCNTEGVIFSTVAIPERFQPPAGDVYVFVVPVHDNGIVRQGLVTIDAGILSWFAGDIQPDDVPGVGTSFSCQQGSTTGVVASSVSFVHDGSVV